MSNQNDIVRPGRSFGKEIGVIQEMLITGRKAGAGRGFYSALAHNEVLFKKVVAIVREELAKGTSPEKSHIVNCNESPILSLDDLRFDVKTHYKMGKVKLENRDGDLYVNGQKVVRYLSREQNAGEFISSKNIRKKLSKKLILNACILEHLIDNPELIPEEWKNGMTFFWGTILRRLSDGSLFAAGIGFNGTSYGYDLYNLKYGFGSALAAAYLLEG